MTEERKGTIFAWCVGIGSVLVVIFFVFLPHWLRHTGPVTGKNHVPSWVQHHEAWDEYHHAYTSTWTETDPNTHRKHTYTTYHPGWTEHHNAYDEFHPDQWWIFVSGDPVSTDQQTFTAAEIGDWWGADGFYGTKLVKTTKPE